MYIILAILLFGILIAIHEFGHFISAKSLGVQVNEFAIGMGPAIYKKQKGETLYALRAFPIGGYCALEGEDEKNDNPRSLTNQPAWKSFIIMIAGSAVNFLFGIILLVMLFAKADGFSVPVITSFMEGCIYESDEAFKKGDRIYSIDGHRIFSPANVSTYLQTGGDTHDIVVVRDGAKHKLDNLKLVPQQFKDGLFYGLKFEARETGFWAHIKHPLLYSIDFVRDVWRALSGLIAGTIGLDMVSGPVGIVSFVNNIGKNAETTALAIERIVYLGAFISINLAVMNMLPLPALDGGRVLFLLVNGAAQLILRRKINTNYERYVHAAGMALLLAFMAFIMYNDISRLIR